MLIGILLYKIIKYLLLVFEKEWKRQKNMLNKILIQNRIKVIINILKVVVFVYWLFFQWIYCFVFIKVGDKVEDQYSGSKSLFIFIFKLFICIYIYLIYINKYFEV